MRRAWDGGNGSQHESGRDGLVPVPGCQRTLMTHLATTGRGVTVRILQGEWSTVGVSRTSVVVLVGAGTVAVSAAAAAVDAWNSEVNLRSGLIPWAFGALAVGVALILFGSFRGDIGRPRWLLRCGSSCALVGLAAAGAFMFGTAILSVLGSNLLSTGDTLVSALGTLFAGVCTLVVLPVGLLALGVAVLADKELPPGARWLPLVGTLVFLAGPVLVAVLPDADERWVLVMWPVVLAAAWATYGVLVAVQLGRQCPNAPAAR